MPRLGWRFAHLFALSGMAVAQPLLSLLGDNPTFFTAHDSSAADIVWFAVLLAIVPPAVCAAIVALVHASSPTGGEIVHVTFVGLFGFLFVLPVVDDLPGPWFVVLVVAAAAAAGIAAAYRRFSGFRTVVSVLVVAPVAFVALFLFVSPVNAIVFPDEIEAIDLEDLVEDLVEPVPTDGDTSRTLAEQVNDRFPPIFLLVFDELPWPSLVDENGEVDAVRYPNFARLASTSHVFTDTTATGIQTEQSVPILLTGVNEVADAPVYSLYPDNLFTLLGGVYDVSSSDSLVDLCPPSVCDGQPPAGLLDLLATEEAIEATSTTTTTASTTTRSEPPVEDESSPFDLLLEDAAIVYGHLVGPSDMDLGLPSIGSSWGSFGRGVGSGDPTPTTTTTPSSGPTTSTTSSLAVDVGIEADIGSVPPVAADAVSAARTELLDSLITDDSRVADMRAEILAIAESEVPRLDYLHVLLPHVPWRHHPDGSIYADINLPGYFDLWNDDDDVAAFGQQRHLLQSQFADLLLGEYLDRLEALGVFDRATVIVTADHGISFVAGGHSRGLFTANSGGIAAVPLIWKRPGQSTGERHRQPVSLLDIVPSLAGQLKIEIPWEVDGLDLFGELPTERTRFVAGFGGFAELPDLYPELVEEVIADLHHRFGTGTTGSAYSLGGSPELIGASAEGLVGGLADACWVLQRPQSIPEAAGEIGYVFGWIDASRPDQLDYAIVVDGVVAGTSRTYTDSESHNVYGLGDPDYWRRSETPVVELHEIVDGRLRRIPRC